MGEKATNQLNENCLVQKTPEAVLQKTMMEKITGQAAAATDPQKEMAPLGKAAVPPLFSDNGDDHDKQQSSAEHDTPREQLGMETFSRLPPSAHPCIGTNERNVDDVIHNIIALAMSVFKQRSSTAAITNGNIFPYKPVPHQYDSIAHLENVLVPLMKAELWTEIEKAYSESENTQSVNVQMNYCSQYENHRNRYNWHCESQSPNRILNGQLVLILNVDSGSEFFAYIIKRNIRTVPLKLTPIMYLWSKFMLFEALFKLKHSPVLEHILQPMQNHTKPQNRKFNYAGYNQHLNEQQMIAVNAVYSKCVARHPFVSLIEGPPGTGKSTLLTNLLLQLLYGQEITHSMKILVCAPTNAAVDVLTKNQMHVRENYTIKAPHFPSALDHGPIGPYDNAGLKMDMSVRTISTQSSTYDNKNGLLQEANVICTTLNSCSTLSSIISTMDVCIIDEATQCNEPTSFIPLQFGVKHLVLVGDTKQLPPTVLCEVAKNYNYHQSMFERLAKPFESKNKLDSPILQLTTQYRMHPEILHWPNHYFYENQLTSVHKSDQFALKLKPYTVFNLNYVQSDHHNGSDDDHHHHNNNNKHISNVDEAKFVCNLLDFLVTQAKPQNYTYGIISPYSQQKNDLAIHLSKTHPYVTVNTIDSYQGQERDIIIVSIARTRGIGFLASGQRLNVALTRAKKMLVLCGNFNSLQTHPIWTHLLDDARNRKLLMNFPMTIEDNRLYSYFQDTLTT